MADASEESPESRFEIAGPEEQPGTRPAGRRFQFAWLWAAAPLSQKERLFWASCACLLCAHTVFSGLIIDDFLVFHQVHRQLLPWGLLHAFHLTGDVLDFAQGREMGLWPWWMPERATLHFFRPLTALTHALDVRLLHDAPWLMHVENLLILLLLTWAALRWFQTLLPDAPQVVRVASVLYAVSPGHAANASWLSARNACLATLFAILSLLTHHRARQAGRPSLLALSTLCLALSLLSGEMGSAALAFLVAHACFLDRAPWRVRLAWLTPALLTAACWLAIYMSGGYGARESSAYVSLLQDPVGYLKLASLRLPLLLFGSFGWPVAAFNIFLSSAAQALLALLGLVFFAALSPRLWAAVRSDPRARFCAAAFCLSILPILSTFAHDRLLIVSDLAAFPLLALALLRGPQTARSERLGRWLLQSRVVVSVLFVLINSGSVWEFVRLQRRPFEVALPAEETRHKALIFINPPCVVFPHYLFYQREYEGLPGPRRVRALSQGILGMTVRRSASDVLSLRSEAGLLQPLGNMRTNAGQPVPAFSTVYLAQLMNQVSRSDLRIPVDTQIRLSDVVLTVVETTPEGWPRELRAHFRAPLESDQFQFVQWKDDSWQAWPLPRVGETVTLEPIRR